MSTVPQMSTFFQISSRDEHCFFNWAIQMRSCFKLRKVDEYLLSRWASQRTSYQMSKVVEHKFSSKSSRLYFWNCMNSMALGAQNWAQLSKADEHFFSDEQKRWALFFQLSNLSWALYLRRARWVEHFFSDKKGQVSTFFLVEHLSLLCYPPPQWRKVLNS